MNMDEIQELIRLMVENDLAELDITDGENKIRLKRSGPVVSADDVPAALPAAPAAPPAEPGRAEASAEEVIDIASPMVGTFYISSSPDSDPFVAVGTEVGEGTVVCILEAMKVMNEIKAECAGRIAEICVANAQPVEYGQVLFRVKPR